MVTSFWSNRLVTEEEEMQTEAPQRVAIKHNIPTEETHELAVDIYETEDRVYVVAPLAGVKSSDLEISVDADQLFVRGMRRNPFEEYNDKLYSSECFWGKFERKLTLPSSVDTRSLSATFRNGILLIEAPRVAPSGVRRIHVN